MGDFHTCVFFVRNPMHKLVTDEAFQSSLFSCELGTGIIEMHMPKGLRVDFSVVEEWRRVLSIRRADNVEAMLRMNSASWSRK